MAELRHRSSLDLADALPGEVEVLADLFEGAGLATVEAEAELEDLALAVVERGEEPVDLLGQERGGGHLEGRLGGAVLDDVAELGVAVLAQRLGERQRLGGEAQRLGDLVLRHLDLGRELGERGRAAELQLEAGPGLLEAGQGVAGVDRQADRAAGVGDAAGDRLADPPRGVGGELEALAPVELLDGVHQAEVALLDQVEQRQARGLVLLGDRHDEAQVGLHEGALGGLALAGGAAQLALAGRGDVLAPGVELGASLVAGLDGLGQTHLVVLGQQRVLTDVREVQADEVFLVALDALLGHRQPFLNSSGVEPRERHGRGVRIYDTEPVKGANPADRISWSGGTQEWRQTPRTRSSSRWSRWCSTRSTRSGCSRCSPGTWC